MTFTYLGTMATDLDEIRFAIGDTVASSGPKPNGGNFTDEEINGLKARENDSVGRTIARLYETLAILYAPKVDTKMGPRDEKLSQEAAAYRAMAKDWRDKYGYTKAGVTTSFVTRVDGYSDDIDSGET